MSDLRSLMTDALDSADLDSDDDKAAAMAAIEEAIILMSGVAFGKMPWCGVSDEGIISLLWQQQQNRGVFLCFSGDGTFAFSTKNGEHDHYTSDYTERPIKDGIPNNILVAINTTSVL